NSNSTLTGDMYAGGTMDLPAWTLAPGYTVSAVGNISGANGTASYGDINTQGSFSGVARWSTECSGMASCYTHTPVALPPQTSGTAIPTLTTDCTGTTNFSPDGTTAT